jgi:hypothetical protein
VCVIKVQGRLFKLFRTFWKAMKHSLWLMDNLITVHHYLVITMVMVLNSFGNANFIEQAVVDHDRYRTISSLLVNY